MKYQLEIVTVRGTQPPYCIRSLLFGGSWRGRKFLTHGGILAGYLDVEDSVAGKVYKYKTKKEAKKEIKKYKQKQRLLNAR